MILLIGIGVAIIATIGLGWLLTTLLKANLQVMKRLDTIAATVQQEQAVLRLQKEVAVAEINLQSKKLEQAASLAKNAVYAMKSLSDKAADEKWAEQFSAGRDKASWN